MYEELECGCIMRIGSYGVPTLDHSCNTHWAKGMLSKGFKKLKVVKRYKRRSK